jgi:hypothetical protein
MFEVGKVYTIRMDHPSGATSFKGTLIEVDLPLNCNELGDGQRIVNVNSPLFVGADRADEDTAAALHERHQANRRSHASPHSNARRSTSSQPMRATRTILPVDPATLRNFRGF